MTNIRFLAILDLLSASITECEIVRFWTIDPRPIPFHIQFQLEREKIQPHHKEKKKNRWVWNCQRINWLQAHLWINITPIRAPQIPVAVTFDPIKRTLSTYEWRVNEHSQDATKSWEIVLSHHHFLRVTF
jgi:hypothetical protein